jgi:pyridoxamine 5'-phosphate oxidase-like protein
MSTAEAQTILRTDPVAQQLLQSAIMARLAYVWPDGTPRVLPMWFHWTGDEILMGAPPNSPKMKALPANPAVALSIDGEAFPYPVLLIRGAATTEILDGPFPEYGAMARRYLGDEGGDNFIALVKGKFPRWSRIAIRPEAVRILDFQARFPSAWS